MSRNEIFHLPNWIAGIQWFFFIFANIVVIPITIGEAFDLSQARITTLMQMSFIVTGIACLAQSYFGHQRPIIEGQSGLWWGIFLTLVTTATAQGMPLHVLGGSLALGVIISGVVTILIALLGLGKYIAKLFTDGVMSVFVLLLGFTLIQIFLKGMLGIPFGVGSPNDAIDLGTAGLAIFISILVIIISIRASNKIKSYALLIGIIIGWMMHRLIFGTVEGLSVTASNNFLFPLGNLTWDSGVVLTCVLAGLLNLTNTFGAIKGTDPLYKETATNRSYVTSLTITGVTNISAGMFGLVPYSPYVSSIGYLRQTNIYERMPFVIGSFLFFLLGVFPKVSAFFTLLPLSIGSAVLFVAYLQLFLSAFEYVKAMKLTSTNVYRIAIPIFVGGIIMAFPAHYFSTLPSLIQPFFSNGLLVGIVLAIVLENIFTWDRIGDS